MRLLAARGAGQAWEGEEEQRGLGEPHAETAERHSTARYLVGR